MILAAVTANWWQTILIVLSCLVLCAAAHFYYKWRR